MKKGSCKYFTGIRSSETCEAGVCYADVIPDYDDSSGIAYRVPCRVLDAEEYAQLNDKQRANYDRRGTCDKFTEPTDEELKQHAAEIKKAIQRMQMVMPLIGEVKNEHKGKDWKGTKTCPVCEGVLHLTHAAYNGHVWGQCETDGCLAWME